MLQGSWWISKPNNALLTRKSLKITIDLHCLIPPKMGNSMIPVKGCQRHISTTPPKPQTTTVPCSLKATFCAARWPSRIAPWKCWIWANLMDNYQLEGSYDSLIYMIDTWHTHDRLTWCMQYIYIYTWYIHCICIKYTWHIHYIYWYCTCFSIGIQHMSSCL